MTMPLITSQYLAMISPTANPSFISAATGIIERYCDTHFYARRDAADNYSRRAWPSLSLRHSPLIQLNGITLFPDEAPQTFTASQFDIRYRPARLAFKPTVGGTFWSFPRAAGITAPQTQNDVVSADYFAGYGWVTSLSAAINPGSNVPLPLAATNGITPEQGPWNALIASNTDPRFVQSVVLDSGQSTEETVSVTVSGNTLAATSIMFAHTLGAFVSGPLPPQEVALACALVCANLTNQPDLTKAGEQVGRLGGYVYTTRKGNLLLTEEIRELLAPFRNVTV